MKSVVPNWCNLTIYSSALILALTGALKLASSFSTAGLLQVEDPVLGIANGNVYFLIGLLEVLITFCLLLVRQFGFRLLLIAFLAVNFLTYKMAAWWMSIPAPCSCLGNPLAWTALTPSLISKISNAALVWLLFSSFSSLVVIYRFPKRTDSGI
jgi:hypothetical protein